MSREATVGKDRKGTNEKKMMKQLGPVRAFSAVGKTRGCRIEYPYLLQFGRG